MADSTMILFAGGVAVVTIYTLSWSLDWAVNEHTYLNAGKTLCAAPYSPTRLEICSSRSRMDPYCMERGQTDIERAFEFKASICPQSSSSLHDVRQRARARRADASFVANIRRDRVDGAGGQA